MTPSVPHRLPAARPVVLDASHRAAVWRYLRILGCSADEADDVCQETFARLLGKPTELAPGRGLWSYLMQAARWEFLRWRRHRTHRGGLVQGVGDESWVEAVDDGYGESARKDGGVAWLGALQDCVGGLAPRARQAVHLAYVEQRSRREIAQALGLRENGVKTLLQRTRALLGACIERRLEVERREDGS